MRQDDDSTRSSDAELEEQRWVAEAIRQAVATVEAPPSLRHKIEEERRRSAPAAKRRRFQMFAGFVTAAAAAVVIAVALLPTDAGGPTAVEAASLSAKQPTDPAPPPDPDQPAVLDYDDAGIPYPNWDEDFDWKASGEREDEIEGRDASTIYYDRDNLKLGYTIVSGDEIDPPENSKVTEVDGEKFWTWTTKDGRNAVLWYRDGRTCVMAGKDVPNDALVKLAAWEGGGAVTS